MAESEDKGYTVKDRRYLHMSEEEKARVRDTEKTRKDQTPARESSEDLTLPEISFSSFIISLSSSAFMHLGDIPDPASGEIKQDLPIAKQTIDLLGLLREKTRNNLAEDEEKLFDHLLYDLRMRYVKLAS